MPWKAYGLMAFLLVTAAFGQPLPEEFSVVVAGLLSYMVKHPGEFPPPPDSGAIGVNAHVSSIVCLASIMGSDLLIFWLGRRFGPRVLQWKLVRKFLSADRLERVCDVVRKWGYLGAALFRFTPGLRFPGHFSCGMLGLSAAKFTLADGLMALITVPGQIYLIAAFGHVVIGGLRLFNGVLAVFAIAVLVAILARLLWRRRRAGAA